MKKNNIIFFGLLHVQKKENTKLNFKHNSDEDKILVYLKNAVLLSKQLKIFNYNFILLTNNKIYLNKLLNRINEKINIKQLKFKTFVPKKTHFFSCHFRIDIFNFLSKLKNNFSILIDLDVLVFKKSLKLQKISKNKIGYVHNISSNVIPAYGYEKILYKLNQLDKKIKKVEWYGGDFFAGNSTFFRIMYLQSKKFQKVFLKFNEFLKNETDELFLSCAIANIKKQKLYKIENIADTKIFTRYWSSKIKHQQKSANYFISFDFLHVPADKIFLSRFYNKSNVRNMKTKYSDYLNSFLFIFMKSMKSIIPSQIKILIKNLI